MAFVRDVIVDLYCLCMMKHLPDISFYNCIQFMMSTLCDDIHDLHHRLRCIFSQSLVLAIVSFTILPSIYVLLSCVIYMFVEYVRQQCITRHPSSLVTVHWETPRLPLSPYTGRRWRLRPESIRVRTRDRNRVRPRKLHTIGSVCEMRVHHKDLVITICTSLSILHFYSCFAYSHYTINGHVSDTAERCTSPLITRLIPFSTIFRYNWRSHQDYLLETPIDIFL
mgnify:FL=1